MKVISYSLFGYERERAENCFDFESYLIGLMLSLRVNKLLFPNWRNVLQTDINTYNNFEKLFKALELNGTLILQINDNGAKLCEAMLWRLKPIFWDGVTHVLCRDLDSLHTYREAQAVQHWIKNDTAIHTITDSSSHGIPMLGGMIGFIPDYFKSRMKLNTFEELMAMNRVDLSIKGSDQTFINDWIYPVFARKGTESITQHYFMGHGKTWLEHYYTCRCWDDGGKQGHEDDCSLNIKIDIDEELKETNNISEHMGAAGWNQTQTMKLIYKHKNKFKELIEIEKLYPNIFTWNR